MADQEMEIARLGFDGEGNCSVREPIFITVSEFKGKKYLNVRKYYEENGQWKPTKKGITFGGDQFEEFLSVLNSEKANIVSKLKG